MYSLYFEDAYGKLHFLSKSEEKKDLMKVMNEELDKRGIKPYYIRCWEQDGVLTLDYGSHSSFYKIFKD